MKLTENQIDELISHNAELVNQNIELMDRLKDIELGRIIKLPNQLNPVQYNAVLNWLKEQRKTLQKAAKSNLPKEI